MWSASCNASAATVIVLGFFLPPVSIVLMTAPIILPPLKAAGFDLIWFGVLLICIAPGIATALPDAVMGVAKAR